METKEAEGGKPSIVGLYVERVRKVSDVRRYTNELRDEAERHALDLDMSSDRHLPPFPRKIEELLKALKEAYDELDPPQTKPKGAK